MSKLETNTIDTISGTNTLQVGSSNVATVNVGASGDTVNVGTGATVDSSNNLKFNSGFGSVTTVYGVRAWVNFNGTGTLAIKDSGNVSSVTDNGTGSYTPNFSTNMPDVNFTAMTNAGPVISTGAKQFNFCSCNAPNAVGSINITNRSVDIDDDGFASADNAYVGLIVIR